MARKARAHTYKKELTTTIAFVDLPTLAAFLASVLGGNQQHRNPDKLASGCQELPQLVERPIGVSGPVLLVNPDPQTIISRYANTGLKFTVCSSSLS
jgi:hypothetical protein